MSTEKQIPILCLESYQVTLWPLSRVLEEINRDRSSKWTDYTEDDWEEGWDEWVEGEFYSRIIITSNHNALKWYNLRAGIEAYLKCKHADK